MNGGDSGNHVGIMVIVGASGTEQDRAIANRGLVHVSLSVSVFLSNAVNGSSVAILTLA